MKVQTTSGHTGSDQLSQSDLLTGEPQLQNADIYLLSPNSDLRLGLKYDFVLRKSQKMFLHSGVDFRSILNSSDTFFFFRIEHCISSGTP